MEVTSSLVLVLEVIAIVALLGILASALGSFRPYDQLNYANAKSLQSSINQVCQTGGSVEMTINMPQSKPVTLGGLLIIITEFIMKIKGDPDYVLYYESFPPGEGIGWEVHQGLPARFVIPYLDGKESISSKMKNIKSDFKSSKYPFQISNIVLTNKDSKLKLPTNVGEWNKNNYKFKKYLSLSTVKKSLIKYAPCGENALCLKTTSGIKRLPLKFCDNVKLIRWKLDESSWPLYTGRQPDFYAGSPCKANVKITKKSISNSNCDKQITYPIYKYNEENDKLEEAGNHVQCIDRLKNRDKISSDSPSGDYIQIEVINMNQKEDENFCMVTNRVMDYNFGIMLTGAATGAGTGATAGMLIGAAGGPIGGVAGAALGTTIGGIEGAVVALFEADFHPVESTSRIIPSGTKYSPGVFLFGTKPFKKYRTSVEEGITSFASPFWWYWPYTEAEE